ncbi:MAG: DUF4399 domain-containing protein [Pseudomonadota bacterium]
MPFLAHRTAISAPPLLLLAALTLLGAQGAMAKDERAATPEASAAGAAPSEDRVSRHPWVVPPPDRDPTAYFTNLADGAKVESPFVARFGLSRRGIIPAGATAGTAGHHHLLIDQPLPLDFQKPLPFTPHYIHFGAGQMEAVVDLPPGPHTLRLVLADQGHIPYFVYSKQVAITVTKQNKGVTPESLLGTPNIAIIGPAAGASVPGPFRLQMHASGFNISHAASQKAGTGHFRLTLRRGGRDEVIDLDGGQTEVWLNPPKGAYEAEVELVGNTGGGKVLSRGKAVAFSVS